MLRRVIDLLWNGRTRRPRLPWRLVTAFVVLVLLGFVVSTIVDWLFRIPLESLGLLTPRNPGAQVVVAVRNVVVVSSQAGVLIGSVYLAGRFVDRRWFRDFGLRIDRSWWLDFGFGLVLGAGLMTGVFLVELAAGWIVITDTFWIAQSDFGFWPWFAWSLVTFVGVGFYEELLTRGYLITNLSEGLTWFDRIDTVGAVSLAVVGSSLLFALGHALNPNASLASAVGIMLAAVMLAAGYVLTGELALPIGIHITWNVFQGTVYGFPVSGTSVRLSILVIEQRGAPILTGGTFGPEAGVLGAFAVLLGVAFILVWVRWRTGRLRIASSVTTPDLRSGSPQE